jgi:hypothetical protein
MVIYCELHFLQHQKVREIVAEVAPVHPEEEDEEEHIEITCNI